LNKNCGFANGTDPKELIRTGRKSRGAAMKSVTMG